MPRLMPLAVRHAPAICAALFFAFGLVAALAVPARGADLSRTDGLFLHPHGSPELRVSAPVIAGTADIAVNGITGRAIVRQTFLNPADAWVEGVYVFPLPEDAAVDRMRLRVDGRIIEGVIAERQVAKKKYREAAASGRRASLLEQERPNLFTMSVANIPPNGRIEVELGYQQAVTHQDGRYSIRFPMAVTPRYLPVSGTLDGVRGVSDPALPDDVDRLAFPIRSVTAPKSNPMAIRVILEPGLPLASLESASHKLRVAEPKENTYDVTLKAGAVVADRDFVLKWTLETSNKPEPSLFIEEKDGAAYLLAMIVPPKSYRPLTAPQPREAIFIIDTSGSMHGESMQQAREALMFGLERLRAADKFNIIAFSDKPRRLFAASRPADDASRDAARSFVAALEADGGTEIGAALDQVLNDAASAKRLRQIVLLTDGAVGNEAQLLTRLRRKVGDSRLFTVAIGSAPNGHFMREAARVGRGAALHISDTNQVRREVTALFAKLERPALVDIKAALPLPDASVLASSPIPDLYHGDPLVLTARLPKAEGEIALTGRLGEVDWRSTLRLESAQRGEGIAKLWARAMVDREMGRLRAGADRDDVRLSVLDLALRHGLLTDYTSLVAVDENVVRPPEEGLARRPVPANPPKGWAPPNTRQFNKTATNRVAGEGLPLRVASAQPSPTVSLGVPTATPATMLGLIGMIALMLSGLFWCLRRRTAP